MERGHAIVLIGFMGAGKTSVGRELARLRPWPLHETDVMLEARFGCAIAEIFATRGEEEFRAAESEVLREMPTERAIVTTGGGIVLQPQNRETLRQLGAVFFLHADEATLFARVSGETKTRPLLQTNDPRATFSRLLADREPLYRAIADHTVDTSQLSATEVAQTIVRHVD